MLFKKVKDIKNRKHFVNEEYKIKLKKFVFINTISRLNFLKKSYRLGLSSFYKAFYLNSFFKKRQSISKSKITRRCLINNRSKTVSRTFNLSRSIFRDLLQFGFIPGYKKAVW
jgi:ribosomal protein S14